MSRFLSKLDVELIDDQAGRWRVVSQFGYVSDVADQVIVVPEGFETDFASVPRIPVAYWLTGDCAHAPAVVHDYLYTGVLPRDVADRVFLEAMEVSGVPAWRRYPMYWAVRGFGGGCYRELITP